MQAQGYRTILFHLLMTTAGLVGVQVDPAAALNWSALYIAVWGLGGILLRTVSTGPAFGRLLTDVGASDHFVAEVRSAIADLTPNADFSALPAAVNGLNDAVNTLLGHPLLQPQTTAALTNALASLTGGSTTSVPPVAPEDGDTTSALADILERLDALEGGRLDPAVIDTVTRFASAFSIGPAIIPTNNTSANAALAPADAAAGQNAPIPSPVATPIQQQPQAQQPAMAPTLVAADQAVAQAQP